MSIRLKRLPFWLSTAILLVACGGTSSSGLSDEGGTTDDGGGSPSPETGAAGDAGTESSTPDADASGSSETSGSSDGPPSYTSSCTPLTAQTGTAINTPHGRLDGYLTYIVKQGGTSSCNGDNSHVHLQVKMKGDIYDVAVDIGKFTGDALFYEADMPLPAGAWSEGWHNVPLSYTQLGLHASQFASEAPATLGQKIESELASANHISVFGDAYSTGNGCHDVHYVNGSNDGAIVINPLSATPHVLFFRFSTQSF